MLRGATGGNILSDALLTGVQLNETFTQVAAAGGGLLGFPDDEVGGWFLGGVRI